MSSESEHTAPKAGHRRVVGAGNFSGEPSPRAPTPAKKNVFCASFFEKLLSPAHGALGMSPWLPCGDSLPLCCVPRRAGAAAAWQAVMAHRELVGPGIPVVFWRDRSQ